MPYFQYEWLLEDITKDQKRQEEHQKKEQEKYNVPKMPKTPTFRAPTIPKVSIPKF